jgi:hypothetical protein
MSPHHLCGVCEFEFYIGPEGDSDTINIHVNGHAFDLNGGCNHAEDLEDI